MTSVSFEPNAFFDLDKTLAFDLFKDKENVWEVLANINSFILRLGPTLDKNIYEERGANVWVAKTASIAATACITGPCIIDENAEIRHCAFIRGNAIVGKGSVVGNSTELKNVVLFDNVQVPHYNYVGDSLLGHRSHLGAGAITSNVKSDKTLVTVRVGDEVIPTGLRKFGAIVGDGVEVGCGSVLCPGTVLGARTTVYPLSMVRGFVEADSIYKKQGEVVKRECR